MHDSADLARDIRGALAAARAMLQLERLKVQEAIELQKRLLHLADRAADAVYPYSENFLENAATKIGQRLDRNT